MSGVESGKRLWDESKSFPSTYEAFESSPIFEEDENYKALYHQLSKYGHPRSKHHVYPQVSASVQEVLENSVLTDNDAKTELDKSVERINAKLKRYVMKYEEKNRIHYGNGVFLDRHLCYLRYFYSCR